jgi:cytochrome c-type biogenesis protein
MVTGLEQVVTSFVLGLLATAAPCVLPLYPGFLAYLSSSPESFGRKVKVQWLGFFVFLGVFTVMMGLGLLITLLRVAVGSVVALITPLSYAVVIALGLLLLAHKNPFMRIPKVSAKIGKSPYRSAYAYGLLYGPIAFPCSGPFLVAIFAISLSAAEILAGLGLFAVFGLGFAVPLFALSLLARSRQQVFIAWFTRHQPRIETAAGALLVAVGLYAFYTDLPFLLTYLGA